MTTDYKAKFVQCLEPVLSTLDGARVEHGGAGSQTGAQDGGDHDQRDQGERHGANGGLVGEAGGQRGVSKSLPVTPKHRTSSARVEFQTDFPEHCQLFDGHMKVSCQGGAIIKYNIIIKQRRGTQPQTGTLPQYLKNISL